METIPFRPLFNNPQFLILPNPVQLILVKIVYSLCDKELYALDYSVSIGRFGETNNVTASKYRKQIVSVLSEVMPEILRIKRAKVKQGESGRLVMSKKAAKSRLEQQQKVKLSDEKDTHTSITPVYSKTNAPRSSRSDHLAIRVANKPKPLLKTPFLTDK